MTETMDGIEGVENTGVAGDSERTRTYSWSDPMASFAEGAGLSGLDFLQAIADGRVPKPPISETLGFDALADVAEGRVVFTMTPAEHHYNPIGSVHGGASRTERWFARVAFHEKFAAAS